MTTTVEEPEVEEELPEGETIAVERVCGVSKDTLDGFTSDMNLAAKKDREFVRLRGVWRAIRTDMNKYQNRMRQEAIERGKNARVFGQLSVGNEVSSNFARLIEDVDRSGADDGEKTALKLKALVKNIDLVALRDAIHRGLFEGKVDAMKLAAQLVGLLNEQEQQTTVPVFNFQINVRPTEGPEVKRIEG